MRATLSQRRFEQLVAFLAAGVAVVIAIRAPGFGDYPRDAGPSITAAAHGDLAGFFGHQPAMGALSLYLRIPFAALAGALGDGAFGMYRWGALPCLLSLAWVAVWLARTGSRRGTSRIGQVLIVAVCLGTPLISDALYYGHPEEILTASLVCGALLAAVEQRVLLTGVLVGLAMASKQWALVAVVPTLLLLERERIRAAIVAVGGAALLTLPMAIGNPSAFHHAWAYISKAQPVVTMFNWLFPFSPAGSGHVTDVMGESHPFIGHLVWPIESALTHPLIVIAGITVPLLIWRRAEGAATRPLLLAAALVLLLRCVLDPETAAYYHLPLLLVLVSLDATAGSRLPLAGLCGGAASFVVLDRFPGYLGPSVANLAYVAATVAAALLILRALRRAPTPALMRSAPEPITAS
jgi:hypothetical protein